MRRSPHPRVELEIAAVRTTRRPEPHALDALLAKVEDAMARFNSAGPAPSAVSRPAATQESLLGGGSALSPAPAASSRTAEPAVAPPIAVAPVADAPVPAPAIAATPARQRPPRDPDIAAPPLDLDAGWQRVIDEVMKKKALLASVLRGAAPLGVEAGVLMLSLGGNHFHKEQLANRANRDLVNQAIQQWIPGAQRFELDATDSPAGPGGARHHPAVQAALNAFQGEVVAVRPRAVEEGESS